MLFAVSGVEKYFLLNSFISLPHYMTATLSFSSPLPVNFANPNPVRSALDLCSLTRVHLNPEGYSFSNPKTARDSAAGCKSSQDSSIAAN